MSTKERPTDLVVSLESVTITLIGYESNAQFVNPLTLLSNRVVDESWVCEMGAQVGLTESRFSYANGVQVEAFEDNVIFRQKKRIHDSDFVTVVGLASRYVEAMGAGDWMGVSFEFLGQIDLPSNRDVVDPEIWPTLSRQLTRDGVEPRFGTNVFYSYPDRRLRVDLSLDPRSGFNELTCVGWVSRELSMDSYEAERQLGIAFGGWESDWQGVIATAAKLLTSSSPPGGSI